MNKHRQPGLPFQLKRGFLSPSPGQESAKHRACRFRVLEVLGDGAAAVLQTAVPQPWIQLLNATHAVNDSLNYRHLLSHSTVLADQLPHPDDGR